MAATVLLFAEPKSDLGRHAPELMAEAPEIRFLLARTLGEATVFLKEAEVNLALFDGDLKKSDGFALVSLLKSKHARIPMVVIADGTPTTLPPDVNCGGLRFAQKPASLAEAAAIVREHLEPREKSDDGRISLLSILLLVELSGHTCGLTVVSTRGGGEFTFKGGTLWTAKSEKLRGEDAAFEMLDWDQPVLKLVQLAKVEKRNVLSSLRDIAKEWAQLQSLPPHEPREIPPRVKKEVVKMMESILTEEPDEELSKGKSVHVSSNQASAPTLKKEKIMALEQHLAHLHDIKGYKASAIMTFTGEVLASDSADASIDLQMVGATFNDIFRAAHEASNKIGLDACRETVIITPKGVVVMACSGVNAKEHFHVIGIMSADGNQALMKMQIEKAIPAIMGEL